MLATSAVPMLTVDIEMTAQTVLVTLAGRAVDGSEDHLRDDLAVLMGLQHARVVLDFSFLDFLSAASLRVLVECRNRIVRSGGSVVVINPQPIIEDRFGSGTLTSLMEVAVAS